MVSTTTFVSVDNVSAPVFAASAAKTGVPTVPAESPSDFKLQGVSINGVAPSTLSELTALGKARRNPDAPDAPPAARAIFSGRSEFTNDVAYFKALLETRMRMRIALEANLESLRDLRAKNNDLIRKRKHARKSRRAAKARPAASATTAATEPASMATESASIITHGKGIPTAPNPPPPNSLVTVDGGASVPDPWQVCSSPISTEDHGDDVGKMHGRGHERGCRGGQQQATHNLHPKEAVCYRA